MRYDHIVKAKFIKRHNRFIAHCEMEGEVVICHIKNTCRCKELLIPGVRAYLEYEPNPNRRTDYSLIRVRKGNCLVNVDSQAPNLVVMETIMDRRIVECLAIRTT